MEKNIAVIKGDGIGPEIVDQALLVLERISEKYGHNFNYTEVLLGGASLDVHCGPLTDEALNTAKNSDAVLLGAV
ncbi:MAG: isocitrate/isopropylmalate family dehydrogenase, partial [Sporomusa sp.]